MRTHFNPRAASLVGALLVALPAAGCAGPAWINSQYRGRVDPGNERVLLMPVVAHRFPKAMRPAIEKQVQEEVDRSFGQVTVSVLPLKGKLLPAGYGNLSWNIALGVFRRGKRLKSPELRGPYYEWLDDLPDRATRFLAWVKGALVDAGVAGASGAPYRYLLAVYVDRVAWEKKPEKERRIRFRVVGGIYDAQESRIVAAAGFRYTCLPKLERIREKLRGIGARFRSALRPVLP